LHLLRRTLLVGVDGPEVELAHTVVPDEVRKGAFGTHEPALLLRDFGEQLAQRRLYFADLRTVNCGVFGVVLGVRGIYLGQGASNVLNVNNSILRRHPGMGVRLTVVWPLANAHWLDAVAQVEGRHVAHAAHEALEPALEAK